MKHTKYAVKVAMDLLRHYPLNARRLAGHPTHGGPKNREKTQSINDMEIKEKMKLATRN